MPMVLNLALQFDARIPQGKLKPGYFNIIWCVTPRHDGQVLFDELVFEAEVTSTKVRFSMGYIHVRHSLDW